MSDLCSRSKEIALRSITKYAYGSHLNGVTQADIWWRKATGDADEWSAVHGPPVLWSTSPTDNIIKMSCLRTVNQAVKCS